MIFTRRHLLLSISFLISWNTQAGTIDSTALLSANLSASEVNSTAPLTIEPLSWWAGMHNPKLQLMLHSDALPADAAQLKVEIAGKDVVFEGIEQTDNPHYLFINLDLRQAKPQTFDIRILAGDKQLFQLPYTLAARADGSSERQGFSNKDVIYLITPDRFANGDPSNDNQADMLEHAAPENSDGRHGGDIEGIRQHLDYLVKLGVTQLWINPLLENNQAQYSYHGYAITNLYRLDPRFGSNQDYQRLVTEAKQRGLGVIKDVVLNHIGSNHWWLKDLPSSDWLNYPQHPDAKNATTSPAASSTSPSFTSPSFTSHRRTTVQDPYADTQDKQDFVDGWFVDSMPDLNQRNPKLATYLIQNSIWWVEYAGLSGIREDTYSYADKAFLTQWTKALMAEYPHFNIVGEEWTANPITVSYWQKGKINADGYTSDLPSLMDFPLYEKLVESLNEPEGWDTGFIKLYEMLANDVVYANPSQLVLFEGNHDTNRIYSLLKENLPLYQMALTYVLTAKRIPQLFYGTEVLMTSPTEGRHDGVVRSDFPGGFANSKVNGFSGKGLNAKQQQALAFVRTLLNYRKHSATLQTGDLLHFVPQNGIYVQFRCVAKHATAENACYQADADKVMVIYNKNDQAQTLDLSRFSKVLAGKSSAISVFSEDKFKLNQSLVLPNAGVMLLELNHQ
ncbi:glycoside hydrolase family 13 protein [Shewanella xiamenensis]|uniref:glycoside hydrolase family 13 protein n=1 Tax=Shewanella xiamenensis TaxID=332186 RepID=UPI00214F6280|nr:glycoside hydrolase family 13 protein [Shewanella xiamenensis]MCR4533896.1 glycoside hydrolase family 13 protein [Shewanella xiamenensis]WHF57319.1 glycoside hydrolase family 13 protein [Shewanella xiamenensis]